ncbi:GGDEF domain-containing protein [Clostridium sp. D33t1_170424_F3]|uniref:GGDEF domain-containing protein n=1 Tax=Clostridium sp. D33t1_170424_F3 TaxID=2787099 RepID=UPI0018A8C2BA|nr:GGDEF domain-containing protein [Clostridium sp. D33t1_170424_F3]
MKTKKQKRVAKSAEALAFSNVHRAFIVCLILGMMIFLLQNAFLTYKTMKQTARTIQQSASAQTSEKVNESLKLLKSLASLPIFYDPGIAWEEKVAKLDQINEYYGYMFICYVDEDIVVYTLGEEPASLASRDHMQKVYASKQPYVTDSFVAGADGKTLNYTVIVPLLQDGVMTGSLFATVVLDDTSALLQEITSTTTADAVLIGSKGQVMCSTNDTPYGASILNILSGYNLSHVTADQIEEQMLNRQAGSFQSRSGADLMYTEYGPVENANWDIVVTVSFWPEFFSILPSAGFVLLGMLLLLSGVYYFVNHHARLQAKSIETMVKSVQEIQKKVCQGNDSTELFDYENIIQLSSKGLNDDLTGAFTRVIFLDRAEAMLREKQANRDGQLFALCFIDLDDLKTLNDHNGHLAGDMALQRIGALLREYGAKYDGLVGRYGGDEFILILRDIDSREELDAVLKELVGRLKFNVRCEDKEIATHCSIGASIWHQELTLGMLIANADKALYDVKCHGKANYSIFMYGEHDEI